MRDSFHISLSFCVPFASSGCRFKGISRNPPRKAPFAYSLIAESHSQAPCTGSRSISMNPPEDFSYRNLSDSEEPPHSQRRGTTSFVVGVSPPTSPTAVDTALQVSDVDVQVAADAPSQPPAVRIPSTIKQLQSNQSDDWAAEEQGQQDVRTLRASRVDIVRRESAHRTTASGAASQQQQQHRIEISALAVVTPPNPSKVIKVPSQPSVNLHGKDLRRFVSIGSIEPISRHSNSLDWSDTIANDLDETDHLSLMDPYYDLTRSKLTKLFSLFHPDGMCFFSAATLVGND